MMWKNTNGLVWSEPYIKRIDVAEMEGDLLKAIPARNIEKIGAKFKKLIEAQNLLNQSDADHLEKSI